MSMGPALRKILVLLFGLLLSGPASAAGDVVAAGEYPWSAIGRVNLAGKGHCTGTLVAPSVVLTAAHCLFNAEADRWFGAEYLHFVAGYDRETYRAASRVVDYRVAAAFDPHRNGQLANLAEDWALLILERPIGHEVGYLGVYSLDRATFAKLRDRDARYARAGYNHDFAQVMSVDFACKMRGFVNRLALIAHECPTQPGDSGGPVMVLLAEGPEVIGVHNGRIEAAEGKFGTAVPSATFFRVLAAALAVDAALVASPAGYPGRPPRAGQLPPPVAVDTATR